MGAHFMSKTMILGCLPQRQCAEKPDMCFLGSQDMCLLGSQDIWVYGCLRIQASRYLISVSSSKSCLGNLRKSGASVKWEVMGVGWYKTRPNNNTMTNIETSWGGYTYHTMMFELCSIRTLGMPHPPNTCEASRVTQLTHDGPKHC